VSVCQMLGFVPAHPSLGTALLSMWLHDPDHVAHLAGNLVALAVVGSVVEPALGKARLVALFVASGVGGALMHLLVATGSEEALVGASGSIAGLMAVAAVIRPRAMLGFVGTYIAMNVLALYVTFPLVPPGTSVACHVGGLATGAAVVVIARARRTVEAWRPA